MLAMLFNIMTRFLFDSVNESMHSNQVEGSSMALYELRELEHLLLFVNCHCKLVKDISQQEILGPYRVLNHLPMFK